MVMKALLVALLLFRIKFITILCEVPGDGVKYIQISVQIDTGDPMLEFSR